MMPLPRAAAISTPASRKVRVTTLPRNHPARRVAHALRAPPPPTFPATFLSLSVALVSIRGRGLPVYGFAGRSCARPFGSSDVHKARAFFYGRRKTEDIFRGRAGEKRQFMGAALPGLNISYDIFFPPGW